MHTYFVVTVVVVVEVIEVVEEVVVIVVTTWSIEPHVKCMAKPYFFQIVTLSNMFGFKSGRSERISGLM